jgi:hypothetical protein
MGVGAVEGLILGQLNKLPIYDLTTVCIEDPELPAHARVLCDVTAVLTGDGDFHGSTPFLFPPGALPTASLDDVPASSDSREKVTDSDLGATSKRLPWSNASATLLRAEATVRESVVREIFILTAHSSWYKLS